MKKPEKPYIGYPLFAHNAGVWAKKINGRFYYFGPWDDPQAALDRYLVDRDFLYAGRTPPSRQNTVAALVAAFLGDKQTTETWATLPITATRNIRRLARLLKPRSARIEISVR